MSNLVRTRSGLLSGFLEDGVHKFFGIPYAQPPVGDLRWRAPAAPLAWPDIRQAKQFGSASVQTAGASFHIRAAEQSEDCLYLNVWTASSADSAKRPVMVWIHGGGNLGGAGCEDAFDGSVLATKGVVVVTFNYRLGALGFLAHPDVGANFGLLDQVAALSWVQANIAEFGGDPGNVTVFGQSAGAFAVRALLSCPPARGLFQRAIIQSAGFEHPAFAKYQSLEGARMAAEELFERLGSRELEKLRQVPTHEIKIASHQLSGVVPVPGRVHTPAKLVWMPVADDQTLVESGFPGWPEEVPLMLGWVENEARYFIKPGGAYPREASTGMAQMFCGPKAQDALTLLDEQKLTPYQALDRLFTTAIWTEPAFATALKFAELGRRFYCYHFNRISPGALASQELAKHTAEIRYVFGNFTDDGVYNAIDDHVCAQMQEAWTSFAAKGIPESASVGQWPRYEQSKPLIASIEDTITIQPFVANELVRIINSTREAD